MIAKKIEKEYAYMKEEFSHIRIAIQVAMIGLAPLFKPVLYIRIQKIRQRTRSKGNTPCSPAQLNLGGLELHQHMQQRLHSLLLLILYQRAHHPSQLAHLPTARLRHYLRRDR